MTIKGALTSIDDRLIRIDRTVFLCSGASTSAFTTVMLQRKPTRIELKAEDREEVILLLDCSWSLGRQQGATVDKVSLMDALIHAVRGSQGELQAKEAKGPLIPVRRRRCRRCRCRWRPLHLVTCVCCLLSTSSCHACMQAQKLTAAQRIGLQPPPHHHHHHHQHPPPQPQPQH